MQLVVHSIKMDLEKGVLVKNAQLRSINNSSRYLRWPETQLKTSNKQLKKEGFIASGKGYAVISRMLVQFMRKY